MHLFTCETAKPFEELVRGSQTVVEIQWERSFGIFAQFAYFGHLWPISIVSTPLRSKQKSKKDKITNDDGNKYNVDASSGGEDSRLLQRGNAPLGLCKVHFSAFSRFLATFSFQCFLDLFQKGSFLSDPGIPGVRVSLTHKQTLLKLIKVIQVIQVIDSIQVIKVINSIQVIDSIQRR